MSAYMVVRNDKVLIRVGAEPARWVAFDESDKLAHRYAVPFPTFGAAVRFCRMNGGSAQPLETV